MVRIYIFPNKGDELMSIQNVAQTFLLIESMSHKKLQKLCYYTYSWHRTLFSDKAPLFENRFEAWVHGPVDPSLYNDYKRYGWSPIPSPINFTPNSDVKEFVEMVYRSYGHLDGNELEYLSHQESPWITARRGIPDGVPCNNIISDDLIISFFRGVMENEQQD